MIGLKTSGIEMAKKKIRLLKGIKAFQSVLKSKSNTQGFADINSALNGDSVDPIINEWGKTSMAKKYLNGERLPLNDTFSKNSVGDVRQKFLGKYAKSSDLRDLNRAAPKNLQIAFFHWVIDCHDISHIITDYGQDTTGEILRIEYEIFQSYMRGYWFISLGFQIRTLFLSPIKFFKFRKMVKEARNRASEATNLHLIDWFEYLDEPYTFVKERIVGIKPTTLYQNKDPYWYNWSEKHF